MEKVLAVVLALSLLLALVLTTLTVIRKLERDRNEARYLARRARFNELLVDGSAVELASAFGRVPKSEHASVDLLASLTATRPARGDERRAVVLEAVAAAGLRRRLLRQLGSRHAVRRALAGLLIAALDLPDASSVVAPLMRDRDGDVRLAGVRALALAADDEAARHLIAALRVRDLEPERVIERLGAPWAVPAILHVLEGGALAVAPIDRRPGTPMAWQSVEASLARALGLAADTRAEPALRRLLRTGGVEERVAAARALASAGTLAASADLEAALADDSWQVRAQAARALGRLGATDAVAAIAAHLDDPAWWARAAAADALVDLGEPGLAVLRDALQHADEYARDRAREALAMHRLGADAG